MVTADQIVAHLVGDYILQSDWMASEKTRRSVAALAHVLCYSLPFLFFRPSLAAWTFIVITHFVVDRWRLARYVCWAKNFLAPKVIWIRSEDDCGQAFYYPSWNPAGATNREVKCVRVDTPEIRNPPWPHCRMTGYPPERPAWLTVWLLIIADNTMHLICNGIALRWL